MTVREEQSKYGLRLFMLYVSFYSAVAVYNTYINLYLSSTGLTNPQIGLIVSVSTVFILLTQMFWATLSDRAGSKNRIISLLYLLAAASCLAFYLHVSMIYLAIMVVLFAILFNPITALQDNLTLELLEDTKTDFGQVRMGGTIGYSITALVTGLLLKDSYRHIFWLTAGFLLVCWLLSLKFPVIIGHVEKKQQINFREIMANKLLIGIVGFYFVFNLGLAFYYNFYPIYFVSIGGDSAIIGTIMFVAAVSEIPILLLVRKVIDRVGVKKLLIVAALATVLRWVLLSFLLNPYLIVATSLLHGIGFTSFSYSVITYINKVIPKSLRARGQTLNVLLGHVIPRIIAGYIGGVASDLIGTDRVILINAVILAVATIVFILLSDKGMTSAETAVA